jgi:hypothetical protein
MGLFLEELSVGKPAVSESALLIKSIEKGVRAGGLWAGHIAPGVGWSCVEAHDDEARCEQDSVTLIRSLVDGCNGFQPRIAVENLVPRQRRVLRDEDGESEQKESRGNGSFHV